MDLQLFKVVDVIDGRPVHDTTSGTVRTVRLQIRGRPERVSEVTINGFLSESFAGVGSQYLDVVLPSLLLNEELINLEFTVLSSDSSGGSVQEILFDVGKNSSSIQGTDLLVQRWVRTLMMTPGSNRYDTSEGVGLMQLAGAVTPANLNDMQVQIARMHGECRRQIIERQFRRRATRTRPDELLLDASLTGIGLDAGNRLRIHSLLVDGRRKTISSDVRVS